MPSTRLSDNYNTVMRLVLLLPIFVALASYTSAQEANNPSSKGLPDAPSASAAKTPDANVEPKAVADKAPRTHGFWDRENILLFSGVAAFRALDYASTRNFQARGRTEVLIPDDVVNNSAGFAALEAAATMTSVGISYIFHRTGHHKLERWLSIGHIGVTAFGDAHNYALKTKRPH